MLMISTRLVLHMSRRNRGLHAMGKVDGCGYNGQQKDAIFDTRGPAKQFKAHLSQFFVDFD